MADKKTYLTSGASFSLNNVAVMAAAVVGSPIVIDLEASFNAIGDDKVDPQLSTGREIGLFIDSREVSRPVYLEHGTNQFYYYAFVPVIRTFLKEGTTFTPVWRQNDVVKVVRPPQVDIDEVLTHHEDNLSSAEQPDGMIKGTLVKDGVSYSIFLMHTEDGESHFYCYFE